MVEQASEQSIFLQAIGLPAPADRAAYLDDVCRDDPRLRAELDALLAAHDRLGSDPPTVPTPTDDPDESAPPAASTRSADAVGTVLAGRYQLLEEIGAGGMGTVWMAQQTEPVKRLVAVKLVKAGMDSKQVIARFEAERQALALMDHPNIAKVFDAGTTEVRDQKSENRGQRSEVSKRTGGSSLTSDLCPLTSGRPFFVMELVKGVPITKFCDEHRLTPRQRLELFVPVCQAIQHAHQKGIIHRDLKPSNVLVAQYDDSPVPKVIDFGVAKAIATPLTEETLHTGFGAVIGTVEYMSPEQASFNQLDVDTRSDIYSLGVLLYELLTGTTPLEHRSVKEKGVLEALRIIREEETPSPSARLSTVEGLPAIAAQRGVEPVKLSRLVRGELDWIVMKALEKDRNRRYETATALAMDVQRYLADEPVLACPPSRWYRLRKFVRRHKAGLAVAGLVLFFLVLLGGGTGWTIRDRAVLSAQTTEKANDALAEAESLQAQGRWREARSAIQRAQALLASRGMAVEQQRHAAALLEDLEMAAELETIRLAKAGAKDLHFDESPADLDYARAFRGYGIDLEALGFAEAAERIRARSIRVELAAALDDWAMVRRYVLKTDETKWKSLLALARDADPDPLRNELRSVLEGSDPEALQALLASDKVTQLPASSLLLLRYRLEGTPGRVAKMVALLRRARELHPGDFWINENLGVYLGHLSPRPVDEILRFQTAAAVLHPQSPGAQLNLGLALLDKGLFEEALAAFDATLRLKPDWAFAHDARGQALALKGLPDAAIAAYREAIRRQPDLARAHNNLGSALSAKGLREDAIAAFREAIRLDPTLVPPHVNLGAALLAKGAPDEAIALLKRAVALGPAHAKGHYFLGMALRQKGDWDGAITAYQEAIRHQPDYAEAHNNLGNALHRRGALADAIAAYRQAIRAKPDYGLAYENLGGALQAKGDLDEAIAAYRAAIKIKPDQAIAYFRLGNGLNLKASWDEAIAAYREAIRLKPDYVLAYGNLGSTFHEKGALDDAIAAFRQALRLKPDYANGYYNLGRVYGDKGAVDDAIAVYREAIRCKPDFVLAHNNLGLALMTTGDLDGAAAALKEALRLQPSCFEAHQNVGTLLALQGDYQEAKASFREALLYQPNAANALWSLARLLVLSPSPPAPDVSEALDLAQKATILAPRDSLPWQILGLVHYRAGNWKAAASALEKAVALRTIKSDGKAWFLLAMAHWQLGNQQEAHKRYQQAAAWMEEHKHALNDDPYAAREHRRFRAEAEELMKKEPGIRNPESDKKPLPN